MLSLLVEGLLILGVCSAKVVILTECDYPCSCDVATHTMKCSRGRLKMRLRL